jgi:hypothetical protein
MSLRRKEEHGRQLRRRSYGKMEMNGQFFARRLTKVGISKEEGKVEEEIFVVTSHIVSSEDMNVTHYTHLPRVMTSNL